MELWNSINQAENSCDTGEDFLVLNRLEWMDCPAIDLSTVGEVSFHNHSVDRTVNLERALSNYTPMLLMIRLTNVSISRSASTSLLIFSTE